MNYSGSDYYYDIQYMKKSYLLGFLSRVCLMLGTSDSRKSLHSYVPVNSQMDQ